jgi:hypothetical protein
LHSPPWQNTLGVKDMRWNVNVDSRGLEARGILRSAHSSVLLVYHVMNCLMRPFHHSVRLGISRCDRPSYDAIVACVSAVADGLTTRIIRCCSECSGTSVGALRADNCFEGAQSSATHALGVECVSWDGISDTQFGDDTLDVINPSHDTACVLSSLEVMHVELVLG